MMCLLGSNTGVLFDKVREKPTPVVEEEPKVVKETETKKKVEKKSRKSKEEENTDIVSEPIKDTKSKPKKSSKSAPVKVMQEENTSFTKKPRKSCVPVSYEETSDILDISNSFTEDKKIGDSSKKAVSGSEVELSQKPNAKRNSLKFVLDGTKRNSELISTSTPVQNTPRRKVVVKTMNTSQDEITDLDSTQSSVEQFKSPSPDGRGKFFSIGKLSETPDGRFKINLNRVKKPSQTDTKSSTPIIKNIQGREGSSKKIKSSSSKNSSPAVSTPLSMFPTRISRSAAKEVGVSPSKLNSMIWDSPKVSSNLLMLETKFIFINQVCWLSILFFSLSLSLSFLPS